EAWVSLVVFAAALTWSVSYCYLRGYEHDPNSSPVEAWLVSSGLALRRTPDDLRVVLGMPDWVCYGIFVPWVLCAAFTMLYSSFGMPDDDLGAAEPKGAGNGH